MLNGVPGDLAKACMTKAAACMTHDGSQCLASTCFNLQALPMLQDTLSCPCLLPAALDLMHGLPYIRVALNADSKEQFSKGMTQLVEKHYGSKSAFDFPLETKLYILQRQ